MNWLTNLVKPKIQALVNKKNDIPDTMWHKCPGCEKMLFHRDLQDNLRVCQHCGHHMRLDAKQRLELLFDGGRYHRVDFPCETKDPIKFKDTKKYVDRLKDYRHKTDEKDAIIVAEGKIDSVSVVVAAFNFSFMGGSMGVAVGEGLVRAAERAVETKLPLIAIPASGGARMQEGTLSLMQLPRTVIACEKVKEAKLPFLVLLSDPTTGGVAMLGDIAIAEPKAMIGFAGRRVIEQTIKSQLPDNFQTAEFLKEHGMVDAVVPRSEVRPTLSKLLKLIMTPKAS